jgi:hypothetical protein
MVIKIQCPCGAKYSFEATPELAARPVKFVCQACGADSSALVDQIVRQQLGLPAAPVAPPAPVKGMPPPPPSPAPGAARNLPMGRIITDSPAPAPAAAATTQPAEPEPPAALSVPVRPAAAASAAAVVSSPAPASPSAAASPCLKHPGQVMTAQCVVCGKAICPKCMEQFGHLCSAYCKARAEDLKVHVPVYAGQKTIVAAKEWMRVRYVIWAAAAVVLALVGGWIWYEFFGSRPSVVFSVKLNAEAESGFCKLVPPDQVLFRHGPQLKRYDLKAKREVWSAALVDPEQIARSAAENFAKLKLERERWKVLRAQRRGLRDEDREEALADAGFKPRGDAEEIEEMAEWMERGLLDGLRFHFQGHNLWIVFPQKAARYDWQTGKPTQEIPLEGRLTEFTPSDAALFLISRQDSGAQVLTRIDTTSGVVRREEVAGDAGALAGLVAAPAAQAPTNTSRLTAGPARTAQGRTTNASGAAVAKIRSAQAPPAEASIDDGTGFVDASRTEFVHAGRNVAQVSVRLVKKNMVAYQAMRDKPRQSELDKGVSAANATAAINEVLNEWQEDKTGGKRWEDESTYRVIIRRLLGEGAPDWNGEVTGPPQLFSTPTVDVLIAGKTVIALDKSNRKLWEGKLAYTVSADFLSEHDGFLEREADEHSPCFEHGSTLYLFDQGMLTAFELATGNVLWRLPAVGINQVQAGEEGILYVTTTSAGADRLKYSQQIDLSQKIMPVLLKVDARAGKILWRVTESGSGCHLSGKFLYLVEKHVGDDTFRRGGLGVPEHTRISRLNPRDGSVMWEYYEYQYPLAMDFHQNTIQVLFRKELRVLKFRSL